MIALKIFFSFSWFCLIRVYGGSDHNNGYHLIRDQLKRRHGILKQLAQTALTDQPAYRPPHCPQERLIITEYAFGRSGNNLIEFTHGLWLGRRLNATLVVPSWLQGIFAPFDTTFLQSIYCYTLDVNIPKGVKVYEMTSENSFFLFQLKKEFAYPQFIPEIMNFRYEEQTQAALPSLDSIQFSPSSYSSSFINELSRHFVQVYAGLWCCPHKKLSLITEFMIEYFMKGSLGYAAVHKRQFEGGCSKVLSQVTTITDYPSKEIPLNHPDWTNHPLHKVHPICEMSASFIQETLSLNHRRSNLSNVFIAYDGHGDISHHEQEGAVFLQYFTHILTNPPNTPLPFSASNYHTFNIPAHLHSKLVSSIDSSFVKEMSKYVDMLIAIHSEFFILNPRSTFSFQIYVIRACLGLQSVPVIRNNDFYMQKVPDELKKNDRNIWVSWMSVVHAVANIVSQ